MDDPDSADWVYNTVDELLDEYGPNIDAWEIGFDDNLVNPFIDFEELPSPPPSGEKGLQGPPSGEDALQDLLQAAEALQGEDRPFFQPGQPPGPADQSPPVSLYQKIKEVFLSSPGNGGCLPYLTRLLLSVAPSF